MNRRLRRSFAAKLIVGGCVLALVVVGGVASYLIYSRTSQTEAAAQSNADNRVAVMAQVLDRFTGAEALSAATSLAVQAPLREALRNPSPPTAVAALFAGSASPDVPGEMVLVSDATGRVVYTHSARSVTMAVPSAPPQAITLALSGGTCAIGDAAATAGGCGVEILGGGIPAYVVALPVVDGTGTVAGAVAYIAPMAFQLDRFQSLFGFPTAFIPASDTGSELRPTLGQAGSTDPRLRAALSGTASLHHAIYDAPLADGSHGGVAGSFARVLGPRHQVAGFIGVEVPLSQFVGDERTDVVALALIAVFVLLVVVIAVVLFVERFVKRPIARLEMGVARIAGGDYTTDIPVRSGDELGRLAGDVNTMRAAIAGYVREIEAARSRLDTALERVSGVSRALTTTTGGVGSLQEAVVNTAALIAGDPAAAILALRTGDTLQAAATAGSPPPLTELEGVDAVIGGATVEVTHPDHGALVAVPMFYQEEVVGALIVVGGASPSRAAGDLDVDVLRVLANNAAIAMENARLFEQERETVRRLLELDSLKSDFLATVQHELRTPLTAILGLTDLLEMCWAMWGDETKQEAVRDIQLAANNLHEIVETIIEYTRLEDEDLGLNPVPVPVRAAVDEAVTVVGERHKGGLPVPVEVSGGSDLAVLADAARFGGVLRAVLDNAVKFSEGNGAVTVAIAPLKRGGEVRVTVADQGLGIPADALPRVFDRFFQVDNTATRRHGGAGMGLAMVKRVVEAHGARVEVKSRVGKGTSVVLTWPGAAAGSATDASDDGDRIAVVEPALPVQ